MDSPIQLVTTKLLTETQAGVVKELREVLERAEAGDFLGVAVVAQLKDGSIFTVCTQAENVHVIAGGLSKLLYRIHAGDA